MLDKKYILRHWEEKNIVRLKVIKKKVHIFLRMSPKLKKKFTATNSPV